MTKKIKQTIAFILVLSLLLLALPITAFAQNFIADNPAGVTVDEVKADELMDKNDGTVTNNNGNINHNYGTINNHNGQPLSFNYGTVEENNANVIENQEEAVVTVNNDIVSENYGIVKTNQNFISTNHGTVTVNSASGTISTNRGTVADNAGTIDHNFGIVENNTGTVLKNFGGTVTGGTVTYDYVYKIDSSAAPNVLFFSTDDRPEAIENFSETVWLMKDASLKLQPSEGFTFTAAPVVSGGTLTDNGDGSYTLSDITSDITLTANTEYAPVTDITDVLTSFYAGLPVDLNDTAVAVSDYNGWVIEWEIVDAGTTGASIESTTPGLITTTAPGTLKVRAIVRFGKSESEDFTKDFTISVTDAVPVVSDIFAAVQTALKSGNMEELNTASLKFSNVLDIYNSFNEAQIIQMGEKLSLSGAPDEVFSAILNDWINANVILNAHLLYQNYLLDPTEETALIFKEYYDSIFNNPEYADEDLRALVRTFIVDIDDVYADAIGRLPMIDGGTPETDDGEADTTAPEEDDNAKDPEKDDIPKTGDASPIGMWITLMLMSIAAVIAVCRRKRTE